MLRHAWASEWKLTFEQDPWYTFDADGSLEAACQSYERTLSEKQLPRQGNVGNSQQEHQDADSS